ncbi:MAG TPA: hypothetical protein VLA52_02405 [Thermohalobaculum sp.]|nr:hypothetical protein [Thermohalobaculum sp.]
MEMIAQRLGSGLRTIAGYPSRLYARWLEMRALWRKRRETRFELERLAQTGAWLISDIGLTREEAENEAQKPFWIG